MSMFLMMLQLFFFASAIFGVYCLGWTIFHITKMLRTEQSTPVAPTKIDNTRTVHIVTSVL